MKRIDRRRFLKTTAGVTLLAGAAPSIVPSSVFGANAPSNRIVMGCIGLGGQGRHNMNAFLRIPGVQVVALCDVEKGGERGSVGCTNGLEPAFKEVEAYYADKTRDGRYKATETYTDFRDILARDDIDAVTVCTPDHWHALITIAAARAGKDIYCEKPLANSVAEGRAVCDAVKRYGRVLQTGSHERSNWKARFAAELVRNGRIGKLHTIRVNMPNSDSHHLKIMEMTKPFPIEKVPEGFDYKTWLGHTADVPYVPLRTHFWWRFILDYGGGEMTDRGAHIIDLGQLGNNTDDTGPIEFEAEGEGNTDGIYNAFMKYKFRCRYANGVNLIGESIGPRGLRFEGTEGSVFVNIHGCDLETTPGALMEEKIGPEEIHVGRSPGHHQNFIDCVRKRDVPMASAEIGHRTGSICHLLNIAMRTGKKIKWDPKKEQILGNNDEAERLLSPVMRDPWTL